MQAQAQVGALEAGAVKEQIASNPPKISMADKERRRLTWAQVRAAKSVEQSFPTHICNILLMSISDADYKITRSWWCSRRSVSYYRIKLKFIVFLNADLILTLRQSSFSSWP